MRKHRAAKSVDLARDLDEPVDPASLANLSQWLDSFTVPEPPSSAAAALINRARVYVPAPPRRRFRDGGLAPWTVHGYLTHVMHSAQLLGGTWWVGTALLVLVGFLSAPWLSEFGLPLAILAPPLMIGGVVYGFRTSGPGARAVELSCPVHPVALILTRLLLVAGWVLSLGTAAGLLQSDHAVLPLLSQWAVGVIFYGGLTLSFTFWIGPRTAFLTALAIWLGVLGLGPVGAAGLGIQAAIGIVTVIIGVRAGTRLRQLL